MFFTTHIYALYRSRPELFSAASAFGYMAAVYFGAGVGEAVGFAVGFGVGVPGFCVGAGVTAPFPVMETVNGVEYTVSPPFVTRQRNCQPCIASVTVNHSLFFREVFFSEKSLQEAEALSFTCHW